MPQVTLTNEQVVELVKQLPKEQQMEVFKFLLLQQWGEWQSLTTYGMDKIKLIAQERGKEWDGMTEEEQENLIDELVHEQ